MKRIQQNRIQNHKIAEAFCALLKSPSKILIFKSEKKKKGEKCLLLVPRAKCESSKADREYFYLQSFIFASVAQLWNHAAHPCACEESWTPHRFQQVTMTTDTTWIESDGLEVGCKAVCECNCGQARYAK